VSKDNIIRLNSAGNVDDQLTEILRNGARALLAQAVEAEVADFLGPTGHREDRRYSRSLISSSLHLRQLEGTRDL
jgi:hypothetical protein